jgi:hypothetical protein
MQNKLQQHEEIAFKNAALQDGIPDILCGACLVFWSILMIFDSAGFGGLAFAICFPATLAIRKKIVEPRIGRVQLKKSSLKLNHLLLAGALTFTAVVGVVMFLQFDGGDDGSSFEIGQLRNYGGLLFGLMLAFISTVVGLVWQAKRAHIYAVVIVASFVAVQMFQPADWGGMTLPVMISGCVVLVSGLVLFIRFIKRFPVVSPPEHLFGGGK